MADNPSSRGVVDWSRGLIVLHIVSPDKHVLEWYAASADGGEAKLVEVVFERE